MSACDCMQVRRGKGFTCSSCSPSDRAAQSLAEPSPASSPSGSLPGGALFATGGSADTPHPSQVSAVPVAPSSHAGEPAADRRASSSPSWGVSAVPAQQGGRDIRRELGIRAVHRRSPSRPPSGWEIMRRCQISAGETNRDLGLRLSSSPLAVFVLAVWPYFPRCASFCGRSASAHHHTGSVSCGGGGKGRAKRDRRRGYYATTACGHQR